MDASSGSVFKVLAGYSEETRWSKPDMPFDIYFDDSLPRLSVDLLKKKNARTGFKIG
jgi:hypothetical protein